MRPRVGAGLLALGGLAAAGIAAFLVRPFGAATIDPDAAASVLYFERIVAGVRLEAFVPTTPKPLLTLLYGATWAVVHDWRSLVWEALAVFGAVVALAGWWFGRLGWAAAPAGGTAGGVAAAVFAAAGLALSSDLVLEVSRANSLVWALGGWLVAGLAMTSPQARPGLAGVALLVAGLARFETLAIVGLAAAVLAGRALLALAGRGAPPARRTWLVLLGGLALPVACAHDLLLTGDPLFWLGVPARYTELYAPGLVAVSPAEAVARLVDRYLGQWPVVVAAAAGAVLLVRRRAWVAVIGHAGLGGGVAGLLVLLAVRGTYVSARYYEPLDLVLLGLAAVAVGGLAALGVGLVRGRSSGPRPAGAVGPTGPAGRAGAVSGAAGVAAVAAAATLAAALAAGPPAPLDPRVSGELDLVRTASANLATYSARLATLAGGPGPPPAPGPVGAPVADPSGVALVVPSLLRPRIAVDTGVSLTRLGDTYAAFVGDPPWPGLRPGQHIYHDRAADRPDALDRALEADPASLGGAVARPELVDEPAGVRILVVEGP